MRFLKKETLHFSFVGGRPRFGGDVLGEYRRRDLRGGDLDCFCSPGPHLFVLLQDKVVGLVDGSKQCYDGRIGTRRHMNWL